MSSQSTASVLRWWILATFCLLLAMGNAVTPAQDQDASVDGLPALDGPAEPKPSEPPPPPSVEAATGEKEAAEVNDEGVEVLTRGPVHEAFAEPIEPDPQAGVVAAKQPPETIDEIPPDLKPEGDQVAWIPGYWAWDDERDDFLWVSGIWRNPPPGHRWIPGYWNEIENGWQWVSGFWAPIEAQELTYHEPPPETLEAGPSSPSPGEDYFWVPGCWIWRDTAYRWRPGFWTRYQAEWVWVPARWIWTPRGCLFVPGHWDFRLTRRGFLFAPVYFHAAFRARPHWYYTPRCVIEVGPLLVHFWVRPRYCHYYFGDYYSSVYAGRGFTPWCKWHSHRSHWDPLLTHSQVYHRHHHHIDYVNRMQQWHTYYQKREDERPRWTFREQAKVAVAEHPSLPIQQSLLAQRFDEIAKKRTTGPQKLTSLSQDSKKSLLTDAQRFRALMQERSKIERPDAVLAKTGDRETPSLFGKPGVGRLDQPDRKETIKTAVSGPGRPMASERTGLPTMSRGSFKLPKLSAAEAERIGDDPRSGGTGTKLPGRMRLPRTDGAREIPPSGDTPPIPSSGTRRSGRGSDLPSAPLKLRFPTRKPSESSSNSRSAGNRTSNPLGDILRPTVKNRGSGSSSTSPKRDSSRKRKRG